MRRREFLGKTLVGTAGMALGASGFLTSSCKGANDKVVLAIIGAGGRGLPCIINCCKVNTNVEIKTVCDVNDLRSATELQVRLRSNSVINHRPPET